MKSRASNEQQRCALVPANPEDHLLILWQWRNSDDWILYCTRHKHIVSLEEFETEMFEAFRDDRFLQFMVYVGEKPVGTTYAYHDGDTILITTFIDELWKNKGYGVVATAKMAEYLFCNFTPTSIFFDVSERNLRTLRIWKKLGVEFVNQYPVYTDDGAVAYIVYRLAVGYEDYIRLAQHFSF